MSGELQHPHKRKHNRAAEVPLLTQTTLYETQQKQNSQLVVASVHRQQDILGTAKAAEAETEDKLRPHKDGRIKKR